MEQKILQKKLHLPVPPVHPVVSPAQIRVIQCLAAVQDMVAEKNVATSNITSVRQEN